MEASVLIRALRFGAALVLVLVLQTSIVADLPVFAVRADLVLLMAVAAAIAHGPERGAVIGFTVGISFDLLLQTPFGLSALAYTLTGYLVGMFQGGVLRAAWWIPVASALAGSAFGVVCFAVVGEVLGQEGFVSGELLRIVAVVALINALLVLPALRLVRWSFPPPARPRPFIPGTART